MSIRHFDQPFQELEDFARLRSHTLCLNPILDPIKYFQKNGKIDAKWEGILNPPVCISILKGDINNICSAENIAAVIPETKYKDSKMNCTVMELSGPDYVPSSYGQLLKTDAKWEGVLNPPICATVYKDYYKSICEIDNIAALIPEVDFIDKKMNCTVMELSGPDYIPSSYGQLLVSRSFKYKEHANRFYLRMREVGIMKRLSQKYKELKDPLINFIDHYNERYVVEQDGVIHGLGCFRLWNKGKNNTENKNGFVDE
ncbi:unnamed protein product [Diamesa hyperborea]